MSETRVPSQWTKAVEKRGVRHRKPLSGLRLVVCGKGGAGKSTLVALMAKVLRGRGYPVVVIDGDASNPGGVTRLLFGERTPCPLLEFFGGREVVTCPVDDPSPLMALHRDAAVATNPLALDEISPEYYLLDEGLVLFQVGKITHACEGCDGPMSKIARDFTLEGDHVTLIDMEAGLEHFGRGAERNVDVILVVVDPTFESFSIAARARSLCADMGIGRFWAILNKTESGLLETTMLDELRKRGVWSLGCVHRDAGVLADELLGIPLMGEEACEGIARALDRLEEGLASEGRRPGVEERWESARAGKE